MSASLSEFAKMAFMDISSLDLNAFNVTLTAVVTAWGLWATRRIERKKSTQDLFQVQLDALSSETERLREALEERDKQAEQNHKEILALRKEVAGSQAQIYALETKLAEWTTGVRVLTNQLEAADIKPAFVPSV